MGYSRRDSYSTSQKFAIQNSKLLTGTVGLMHTGEFFQNSTTSRYFWHTVDFASVCILCGQIVQQLKNNVSQHTIARNLWINH